MFVANKIEDDVFKITEQLLEGSELELVDVTYTREKDYYLRVFIDKEGGIGIDDCQALSEKIEEVLDKQDLIKDSYILEVSSPGLDRVLSNERDFVREQGKTVDVTLYAQRNGEKVITGVLTAYDSAGKTITLDEDDTISLKDAAQVRLHIDF